MGLSSSQARLLHLTTRMHQIEYKAAKLEAEKLQMANESDRVYNEYLDALDATKVQYSTLNSDGSVTYLDATYANLCMGYISGGQLYSSGYLGDSPAPQLTGTLVGQGYQLVDAATGAVYVPEYVKGVFNNSSSAEEFASNMIDFLNGNSEIAIDTTTGGNETITGGDDTTTGGGDTTPSATDDIVLETKGQSKANIDINNQITITLKDTFAGKDYTYSIEALDTNNVAHINSVRYGLNGRLKIDGTNLKIVASSDQDDDIILIGNNNYVETGDGNDSIRVGMAKDSNILTASNNNRINAGVGDDYIEVYGDGNVIQGDAGNDSILMHSASGASNNLSSVENKFVLGTAGATSNEEIGWSTQGSIKNCRALALIESLLGGLPKSEVNNYVKVQDNGDKYLVAFVKSGKSIDVQKDEIATFVNDTQESGDLDTILIERAMDKLIKQNTGMTLEQCTYNDIAQVLFGNSQVYKEPTTTFNSVAEMFEAKKQGYISNFIVGTGNKKSEADGIVANHAYTVKHISTSKGTIELVNPWDSNDSITIAKEKFNEYFELSFVFGGDKRPGGKYQGNGVWNNIETNLFANSINAPYQYYIDLYDLLQSSGMNTIPSNMTNSTVWLSNVMKSGAVLKMLDSNNNWVDTSISTNTRLQEVQDTTLLKKAEAKYEADMLKIDRKERKYDADLANMDNERNAIKQEMDTLKSVAKENVERTFKLFS